ncbi:MAG TPA: tetrahydromethanopterin S-methyltransferase subunit D [Methanolinea sp.]|nr:tetrahydromethanopterin S-methyltransferase subunit D [Methanolinea sp.]HPC54624.1 tetrahydromethanopterin S-methyltransferase subunit D [Methanolinea sp.]HQE85589.1 tetrahydromethanopterin S-methyltransferase subunit D [Methanolinea sp.]HQI14478.1 tetrahydromethanopterin S-methyltransferase subunit D [Methanolinea sp.]HQJ18896.1 tetrahydromethanopterin S-methyltransferase subunit D [Methanolinea sp.]
MSAIGAKPAAGAAMDIPSTIAGIILLLVIVGATYFLVGPGMMFYALIGVIVGGLLIAFGVHFVPVGGAPAAMGQAPGIATGVAMLAAGAGLAGLFGGAWAAEQGLVVAVITGAVGGGLMMAITCMFVTFIYVFGMGIPCASGKVAKDPITGDTQTEFKSQGTEGHGLPFVSYVGGVIGGLLGGGGGTLIYIMLLDVYKEALPGMMKALPAQVLPIAVSLAGIFAIGMFLVNAVLTAYNITGTIEGPHDPKFKRFPRALVASAVASALCGMVAILIVAM